MKLNKNVLILSMLALGTLGTKVYAEEGYTVNVTFENFPSFLTNNQACAEDNSDDVSSGRFCRDQMENGPSSSTNNTNATYLQPGFKITASGHTWQYANSNINSFIVNFDSNCGADWFKQSSYTTNDYYFELVAPEGAIKNTYGPSPTFNMNVEYEGINSDNMALVQVSNCMLNPS